MIRIGAVNYLNTKPLIEGLDRFAPDARLTLDLPSRLADQMHRGELDVGLIPVAEFFRAKNYSIIPGCSISCAGPVRR
jgi:chorismate dehydratase